MSVEKTWRRRGEEPRHTNDGEITGLEWGGDPSDVLALPPDDDL